jgi:hypothetical protein
MKRIHPKRIADKFYLSRLLEYYLAALRQPPIELSLKALSFDTHIPEDVFERLLQLHRQPEDAPNIDAHDYHIIFANIMFRYPTLKIWQLKNGQLVIEM